MSGDEKKDPNSTKLLRKVPVLPPPGDGSAPLVHTRIHDVPANFLYRHVWIISCISCSTKKRFRNNWLRAGDDFSHLLPSPASPASPVGGGTRLDHPGGPTSAPGAEPRSHPNPGPTPDFFQGRVLRNGWGVVGNLACGGTRNHAPRAPARTRAWRPPPRGLGLGAPASVCVRTIDRTYAHEADPDRPGFDATMVLPPRTPRTNANERNTVAGRVRALRSGRFVT